MKRKLLALCLTLCAVFVLSGCKTHVELSLNEDDTYNMRVDFAVSKVERPDYSCNQLRHDLGSAAQSKQLSIRDVSTKSQTHCILSFVVPQSITATKAPFVVITRKGDTFRLRLAPSADLKFLAQNDVDFQVRVVFPGQVYGASGGKSVQVVGNTVTWTGPQVLSQGFTAEGRAYEGISVWKRALLVLLIVVVVGAVLFAVLRNTVTARQNREWVDQYDSRWGRPLYRAGHAIIRAYYYVTDHVYALFRSFKG